MLFFILSTFLARARMILDEVPHKIVFVDVDGVLNHFGQLHIDPVITRLLGDIVAQTGAHIVLSSMWRLKSKNRRRVFAAFLEAGLPRPIGYTPLMHNGRARAVEIMAWLRLNTTNVFQHEEIDFPMVQENSQFYTKQTHLPTQIYCTHFCVLDDLDLTQPVRGDEAGLLVPYTVRTSAHTGLTEEDVKRAVDILTLGEPHCTARDRRCCAQANETVYGKTM
jgi:HAD domain in Swiss Army Knife RNA repair proteins